MIIHSLKDIVGTERDVFWGKGYSRRFLLKKDGMGFTMTDTTIDAGAEVELEYPHHLEACYCIEGEGEIEWEDNVQQIAPGVFYALNKHDKHVLRTKTEMRLVCTFSPPLKGDEKHSADGTGGSSY